MRVKVVSDVTIGDVTLLMRRRLCLGSWMAGGLSVGVSWSNSGMMGCMALFVSACNLAENALTPLSEEAIATTSWRFLVAVMA